MARIMVSGPGRRPKVLVDTGDKLNGRSQGWVVDKSVNGGVLIDIGFIHHTKNDETEYYTISLTRDQARWAMESIRQAMENHDEERIRNEQIQADKRACRLDGDRIA